MKNATLLVPLAVATLLCGSFASTPSSASAPSPIVASHHYFKMVRADYIDLAGNHPHSNTFCEVVNTSATTPAMLQNVYVLGSGGITDIRFTYTGLAGQTLPPLGRVRFAVDNTTMPGLVPQTTVGNHGVANVVIGWMGTSQDAVKLSSHIIRHSTGNMEDRTHVYIEGHNITL